MFDDRCIHDIMIGLGWDAQYFHDCFHLYLLFQFELHLAILLKRSYYSPVRRTFVVFANCILSIICDSWVRWTLTRHFFTRQKPLLLCSIEFGTRPIEKANVFRLDIWRVIPKYLDVIYIVGSYTREILLKLPCHSLRNGPLRCAHHRAI